MALKKGCGKFYGKTPWNDENVSTLTSMWESGKTSTEISCRLRSEGYSITRNAVIGKAFRMNIKQPPRGNSPKARQSQPRKLIVIPATHPAAPRFFPKSAKKTKLPTHIATRTLDPDNPGIQIVELTNETCHAIVKDGNRYNLATYCGNPVEEGPNKSFCPAHAAIYYRAPEHRVRR